MGTVMWGELECKGKDDGIPQKYHQPLHQDPGGNKGHKDFSGSPVLADPFGTFTETEKLLMEIPRTRVKAIHLYPLAWAISTFCHQERTLETEFLPAFSYKRIEETSRNPFAIFTCPTEHTEIRQSPVFAHTRMPSALHSLSADRKLFILQSSGPLPTAKPTKAITECGPDRHGQTVAPTALENRWSQMTVLFLSVESHHALI